VSSPSVPEWMDPRSRQNEQQGRELFAQINALRHKGDEEDNEKDKYNDTPFGMIAKSKVFEYVTIGVIIFNAIMIGHDADYSARYGKDENLYKGPIYFAVLECFFCAYFTVEIVVRFIAYKVKRNCIWDAWFVFDSVLVLMMIVETLILPFVSGGGPLGGLNILRLLRLLRITRMAKLMRAFPQLMMIVKGIAAATRAVVWTFAMLILVTFTWAILFTNEYHQGLADDEQISEWMEEDNLDDPTKYGMEFFGSMGKSMLSLIIMGTILDDVTQCCDAIRKSQKMWMLGAFILYILINSFTVMNMLVGILVEVVDSTAEGENNRMREEGVKEAITTIFMQMDKDKSGSISREEFLRMKRDEKVMKALQELEVQEKHFDMYVDCLFQPAEDGQTPTLSFRTLLDCICRLRPGTSVNALDFASFKQSVMQGQNLLRDRVGRIEELCASIAASQTLPGTQPGPFVSNLRNIETSASWSTEASTPARLKPKWRAGNMLEDLEHASNEDILNELHRRGASMDDSWGEGFHTLGVPQNDHEWDREILTC